MASGELHLGEEEDKKKVKPILPAATRFLNDIDQISSELQNLRPIGWIIPPRALGITWGDNNQYWNITDDCAELIKVCWLDVYGSATDLQLEEGKTYDIFFNVSLKQSASGWSECPVYMMAKLGTSGKYKWKRLTQLYDEQVKNTIISTDKLQITATGNQEDRTIHFGMFDKWSENWKSGLIIHEVRVELAT